MGTYELQIRNSQKTSVYIVVSSFFEEFKTNKLSGSFGVIQLDRLKNGEYIDPQVRPIKTLHIPGFSTVSVEFAYSSETFYSLTYYVIPKKRRNQFLRLVRRTQLRKIDETFVRCTTRVPIARISN